MGTTNPSGLRGKEAHLIDHGPGIWHLSETQLSPITAPICKRRISALGNQQQRLIRCTTGSPAPLRGRSSWAGSWTGVMIASDFPSKELKIPNNDGAYDSGRFTVAHHHVNRCPIITAAVYGFPAGPTCPGAAALTDAVLQPLTREVVFGAQGIRVIAGDMNHDISALPQLQCWQQQGWVEAQQLAFTLWGQEPLPTCKGVTQRDFIFLSPEAAALVRRVVIQERFQEHASLHVGLQIPDHLPRYLSWSYPASIPWQDVDVPAWHAQSLHLAEDANSSRWLRSFAKTFEDSLDGYCNSFQDGRLPRRSKGRARKAAPTMISPTAPTLRPSRQGEDLPVSSFVGTAVRQWFKQLRRILSLRHSIRAASPAATAVVYRLQTWKAVHEAPGFSKGFSSWWTHRSVQLHGSPMSVTLAVPDVNTIELIYQDFRANYRRFEAWHLRQRARAIDVRLSENQGSIFAFIREDKPASIDTLTVRQHYTILGVEPSTNLVHVDKEVNICSSSTWDLEGQPANVSAHGDCVLHVDSDFVLYPSQTLTQTDFVTETSDIHDACIHLWQSRWNKSADLPASDLQRIAAFTRAFIPFGKMPYTPLTTTRWRAALRKYRSHAAKGPDGFSIGDLLHLHPYLEDQLVNWFNNLESGITSWPAQLLEGVVRCIGKGANPQGPDDYRPIVIYSLLYRTWAAIRAKEVLSHLVPFFQCHAYGFLPGRETTQVVYAIQALIELASQAGGSMCGYSIDLQKCFNNLARSPVWFLAEHLGIGNHILGPWQAFLRHNQRRFIVRSALSEGIRSNNGFAEGCPLSIIAMLLIDLSYHCYLQQFAPGAEAYSFVDNLSVVAVEPSALVRSWCTVEAFCDLFHLPIDINKSFAWAVTAPHRKSLQQLPFPVVREARDLGGTMSYGKVLRNAGLVDRCRGLDHTWTALKRAPGPLLLRATVLWQALWPRALHGISTCLLASSHLAKLRTSAVRSLRIQRAGANPLLRIAASLPLLADPEFYQAKVVLRDVRRMCYKQPGHLAEWKLFMQRFDGQFFPGPYSKLLQVLAPLRWQVLRPPNLVDHDNQVFDLLACSNGELEHRLEDAWHQHVAEQMQDWPTFAGLHGIDAACSYHKRASRTPQQAAQLAALQDGSFRTSAQHAKFDLAASSLCVRCGTVNDFRHQIVSCVLADEARQPHQWVCDQWDTLPQCVRNHLLVPRNPFELSIKNALHEHADLITDFFATPCNAGLQQLFTDGSCFQHPCKQLSLAAWAVTHAGKRVTIAAGPLQGIVQSISRAEATACLAAILWGAHHDVPICVWTDSRYVSETFSGIDDIDPIHTENFDIWERIQDALRTNRNSTVLVNWIPAHIDPRRCDSPFEEWLAVGNSAADKAAVFANKSRPTSFLDAWNEADR